MEFILCYTDLSGNDVWESVLGEDYMQIRVNTLMQILNCEAEDIMCFDKSTEL